MAVATMDQQAVLAAQMAAQQRADNRRFMSLSLRKENVCQQSNGGAISQSFVAGQPLTFTVTTAANGFATGFWIRAALTVTNAAGTGAAYALNAGAPLNVIDSIQINYGGNQHNFRPYLLKYLSQLRGSLAQVQPRSIIGGQVDTYVNNYYASSSYPVAVGANTWNFAFYFPLNLIHPQDARGLLPIQGGETSCQVIINCCGNAYGPDPVLHPVTTTAGTGGAVTISGTFQVISEYADGQSYSQKTALQPNLSGLSTVQFLRDTNLANIQAGQLVTGKVGFLHMIPWLFLTIVDGNQSNKFCATSNIQVLQTMADATGNKPFLRYGQNTNLDVREFYNQLSGRMGGWLQQDLDEGFLPLVTGPIYEQADPSILEGSHYLNMTQEDGYTDWHYGLQLASVGSAPAVNSLSIAPRVEVSAILLNDPLVMGG